MINNILYLHALGRLLLSSTNEDTFHEKNGINILYLYKSHYLATLLFATHIVRINKYNIALQNQPKLYINKYKELTNHRQFSASSQPLFS